MVLNAVSHKKNLPRDGRQPRAACVMITDQRRQRASMMVWSCVRLCLARTDSLELWPARKSPL